MSITIFDLLGNKVRACCKVDYKDYEISISTVYPVSSDRIAVSKDDRGILHMCFTLEEAITWIDHECSKEG